MLPLDANRIYEPARALVRGNSDRAELSEAVLTTYPITMAAHGFIPTVPIGAGDELTVLGVFDSTHAGFEGFKLRLDDAANQVQAGVRANNSFNGAMSAIAVSVNRWEHYCGVFHSETDISVYLNAGNLGTSNHAARNPTNLDATVCGADRAQAGYSDHFNGRLFWPCIWQYDMPLAEIIALWRGKPPWEIRPELIMSMPNLRNWYDPFARARWVPNGTKLGNPRTYWRPSRRRAVKAPAPAAGGITAGSLALTGVGI